MRKVRFYLPLLLIGFTLALLAGCAALGTQLDKTAPEYAAHPGVNGATTQPANRAAQVSEVLIKVAQDPSANAVASTIPYGSLGLGVLSFLGAAGVYIFGHKNGQNTGQLLGTVVTQAAQAGTAAIQGLAVAQTAAALADSPSAK